MIVNFRKTAEDAKDPIRATEGAAGWDLSAHTINVTEKYVEIGTGVCIAIPVGHVGLLFARSSVSNTNFSLANAVGVIDSDYRGELKLRFKPTVHNIYGIGSPYEFGDRCGQLVIIQAPEIALRETQSLDVTERNEGGFGSTGDTDTTAVQTAGWWHTFYRGGE